MIFGVPRESLRHEHRVGLTPYAASLLTNRGHEVYVERDAGLESHFTDEDYVEVGARVAYSTEEVFGRADIVCRVGPLSAEDVEMLKPGATVFGFLHLAVMQRDLVETLRDKNATVIGYEILERDGFRPVLRALGEIAGQIVIHKAATLLEHDAGGRGVVLGSCPGIPPATVTILGGGTVGRTAAALASSCGAHVIVLDSDVEQLRETADACRPLEIVTFLASRRNVARCTAIADVLIGAINVPGGRAPSVVSEEMVRAMKNGTAIIDLSIDEGGCVATSRPTTLDNPTFQVHGVTHLCVPNLTTTVPRASSRAITLAAMPELILVAEQGIDDALRSQDGLARGAYLYRGNLVHSLAADALGYEAASLSSLLDA